MLEWLPENVEGVYPDTVQSLEQALPLLCQMANAIEELKNAQYHEEGEDRANHIDNAVVQCINLYQRWVENSGRFSQYVHHLTRKEGEFLEEMMRNPPEPNERLKAAMRKYDEYFAKTDNGE